MKKTILVLLMLFKHSPGPMVWPSPRKSNKPMESSRVFQVVTAISSARFHKPLLHAVAYILLLCTVCCCCVLYAVAVCCMLLLCTVYCILLLHTVAPKVERSGLSRENGGISGSNSSTIESDLKALFFMKF